MPNVQCEFKKEGNNVKKEGKMWRLNFPLLQVRLPEEEEMPEVRHKNPLLWMETMRLRSLAEKMESLPPRENEIALIGMLRKQLGSHQGTRSLHLLNESIRATITLLRDLKRWIPRRYSEVFSSEGVIAFSDDYVKLLLDWRKFEAKAKEDNGLSRIREFDARRLLYLAMLLLQIRLTYEKHEQAESCADITRHLEGVFFNDCLLTDKIIFSWHDPSDYERVKAWCFRGEKEPGDVEGLIQKKTFLKCRSFNFEGKEHLVYFDSRLKEDTERLRKMLQKGVPDARIANTDEYGLRFVFFEKEAMEAGLKKLCLEVWPLPFMTWKMSDNTSKESQENGIERNKNSAPNFKALKFKTSSFGFWPEVMIQMVDDYLNHKCSKGPEVHRLYRASQLRKEIFPVLFPREIYAVNWEEKEVEELVEANALSGID